MPKFKIFMVILCSGFLLFGCDEGSNASSFEHTSNAQEYLDKDELQPALIELKNALQKDPDNTQARLLLGRLYVKLGNGVSAEKEINKARALGVDADNIQPLLARALLLQAKFQDVSDLTLAASLSSRSRAELHALRGLAFLYQDKRKEAGSEFDHALAIDNTEIEAVVGKARLAAVNGEINQSREELARAFAIDEHDARAWSLLGDIERSENNLDAAEHAYTTAAENRVANTGDVLNLAYIRIGLKQYDKAEADIKRLRTRIRNHPELDYAEGLLYFQQQRYGDAQSSFERTLLMDSDYLPAFFYAGAAHFMQDHMEQATDYLTQFVTRNPNYIPALKMLAWIKLQNGEYSEAQALIRPAVEQDTEDVFAINLLASALMGENKTTEGLSYFKQAVTLQPDSVSTRMNMGLGLLMEGETEASIAELEKAEKLNPEAEKATIKIIQIYMTNKSYDEALKVALVYRENHPDSISAHIVLGAAYMAKGNMAKAGEVFEEALIIDPGNTSANSGLAAIALRAGQLDKARGYYKDALEKHPEHLRTLMNLAVIESAQGNQDAKKVLLEQAITSNPQALEPRLSLSSYYFKTGGYQKVIELLSPMRSTYPNTPVVLALLAESELAVRNYRQSKRDVIKILELDPNNVDAHYVLALAYAGLRDRDRFYAELNKVLELNEHHVKARTDLVKLMLAEKNTGEAWTHIKILKQQTDNQPGVLLLEGKHAELTGDKQKAIDAYQQAFDKERNNFNLFRLEGAQWEAGNHDKAIKLLESWMEEYPKDHLTQLQLANRYLAQGQEREARMAYTKVSELSPDNVVALNNLAWIYRDTDLDQAVQYAEKAYSLAPDAPAVIDTLAVMVRKSDTTRAQKLIEKALRKSPDDPTFLYHKALILQEAGESDQALQIIQSLLEKYSQFPEKEKAKQMLEDLRS